MPLPDDNSWEQGYGVITHKAETKKRLSELLENQTTDKKSAAKLFAAADRLANAAMWVIAHMSYAKQISFDGEDLPATAFKEDPQGHMGGSLNMAIAYVGYLTANALTGHTRAWTMGQGHCVAAIEAVNALIGDVSEGQAGRYGPTPEGLSQLAQDFYSYAMSADGRPGVPLGSHVGPHTAGGTSEGGYLGFTSTQYIHMPLPGERLVAFLSDGAFEEQRGSDWAPRWWRAEDSGFAVPVMMLNGRRIEQRTEIGQQGGAGWLEEHLQLNDFDSICIDGHDPLAYAWAILEAEKRLEEFSKGERNYPARLPYIIAKSIKGFGFPGAGTNLAHNLPLGGNPRFEGKARKAFHQGARNLFVPQEELNAALAGFAIHDSQSRPKESQNFLATRKTPIPKLPTPHWVKAERDTLICPMIALDEEFIAIVNANPDLRPRIANPDELRSNHMAKTLEQLRHRVNLPEDGTAEAVTGAVITALNEEAVIGAVLGNKGGINLAVSYEAFAMKMLGALRQEIIFAHHQKTIGQKPGWLNVALLLSSHTWENGKNEQSHQDPTLPEALLGEMSDTSRVLFPVDSNSAVAALRHVYQTHGQIACLVTPKRVVPHRLSGGQAEQATDNGAIHIVGDMQEAKIQFVAIGAYQLEQAMRAFGRLEERGIKACVTVIIEPGRFRMGRDDIERKFVTGDKALGALFPKDLSRVILTHTRPEPMLGLLRRLDNGPATTKALGYISRGGTLDVFGMLFANRCTWAHAIGAAAEILEIKRDQLLQPPEILAIDDRGDPQILNQPKLEQVI
jgi:phosphoketolase